MAFAAFIEINLLTSRSQSLILSEAQKLFLS